MSGVQLIRPDRPGFARVCSRPLAISKHIKVLEHAGLITRGRRAQFRPCTIDAAPLAHVASWAERYRHIWDDRFDRMDDYVRDLQNTNDQKEP